jgi:hypothetical protein
MSYNVETLMVTPAKLRPTKFHRNSESLQTNKDFDIMYDYPVGGYHVTFCSGYVKNGMRCRKYSNLTMGYCMRHRPETTPEDTLRQWSIRRQDGGPIGQRIHTGFSKCYTGAHSERRFYPRPTTNQKWERHIEPPQIQLV